MVRDKGAPQSTAPAAVAGRATRAASQDVASTAPQPVVRAARRKGNSEEASVEPTSAGRKGKKNAAAELNDITEAAADEVGAIEGDVAQPAPAVPETQDVTDVPATTGSEQVESALDRDLMLEELSDLYGHAEQVLALTAQLPEAAGGNSTAVLDQWRQKGSKSNGPLRLALKKFALCKDVFTNNPDLMYLNKIEACNAMLGEDHFATHRDAARRLEDVLHLANLAGLAAGLITSDGDEQKKAEILEFTNSTHPDPFLASFLQTDPSASTMGDALAVGSSSLMNESFNIGLEVRVQLALASLAENISDPGDILPAIFIDESAKGSKTVFKGWYAASLGGGEAPLHAKYQSQVKKQYNELVKAFTKDLSNVEALAELKAKHPWDAFVARMFGWIGARDVEIQESIRLRGGIEGIVQQIETAINGPATGAVAPVANMMGSQIVATQGSKRKSLLQSAMLRNAAGFLAEPEENVDTSTFLNSDSQLTTGTTPQGSPPAQDVQEFGTIAGAALRLTQLREANNRPNAKPVESVFAGRKAFADAQANAEIVNFDSQTPVRAKPAKAGGKRKKTADDDGNVTDDGGFEDDNRNVDTNARRLAKAATADEFEYSPSDELPIPAATKKQKTGSGRAGALVRPTQTPSAARAAANPGTPSTPSTSYIDYKSTQQLAKSNTAQLVQKARQARVPWTETEEQALFDFIQQYGTQWSLIKKTDDSQDKLLVKRDQVALKDKARNMYFDFLKAGQTQLPDNFSNVTLSTAQKKKLEAMGLWDDAIGPTRVNRNVAPVEEAPEPEPEPEVEAEAPIEPELEAETSVMETETTAAEVEAEPMEE